MVAGNCFDIGTKYIGRIPKAPELNDPHQDPSHIYHRCKHVNIPVEAITLRATAILAVAATFIVVMLVTTGLVFAADYVRSRPPRSHLVRHEMYVRCSILDVVFCLGWCYLSICKITPGSRELDWGQCDRVAMGIDFSLFS